MANTDISDLQRESLPSGKFPVAAAEPFRVQLAAEVHSGLWAHALTDTGVEICGVLVGKWERDQNGPYAVITNYIRSEQAAQKHAEVTFTQDSWTHINKEMDSKYQDLRIIGWYHSHPDFGIFLSDRDCFIQEHFFSGPGQIAMVVDPVRHLEGIFEWRQGKPSPMHHFWVGDKVLLGEQRPAEKQTAKPNPQENTAAGFAGPAGSPAEPRGWDWMGILTTSLLILLTAWGAFQFGQWSAIMQLHRDLQRTEASLVQNYLFFKGAKLGMERELQVISDSLGELRDKTAVLKEVELSEADRKRMDLNVQALQGHLKDLQQAVDSVELRYGHSPLQLEVLNQLLRDVSERQSQLKSAIETQAAPRGSGPAQKGPAVETKSTSPPAGKSTAPAAPEVAIPTPAPPAPAANDSVPQN